MRSLILTTFLLLLPSAGADDALIAECDSCHGAAAADMTPIIAGLSEFYLDDNLHQYADAYRPCPEATFPAGSVRAGETTTMCAIAQSLSAAQIAEVAAHYSAMDFPFAAQPFDAAAADRGAQLHELQCKRCHADAGTDPFDDAGILAGQRSEYLRHSLDEFRNGERPYPDKMDLKVDPLSAADIDALIAFWAREGGTH